MIHRSIPCPNLFKISRKTSPFLCNLFVFLVGNINMVGHVDHIPRMHCQGDYCAIWCYTNRLSRVLRIYQIEDTGMTKLYSKGVNERLLAAHSIMLQSHCAKYTAEWGRIDNSSLFRWSFLVIPGHSRNDNDNDNEFEQCSSRPCSFSRLVCMFKNVVYPEVPSTNTFHSWLCALKTCSYLLCHTAYELYSSDSYCIPGCSNCILRHSYMTVRFGADQKTVRNKTNVARMCQRLLQSRYSC